MLHSKQLNVFRLRLLPLFLIALFVLTLIPSNVHAGSSVSFVQKTASVHNIFVGATSLTSPNMPNTVKGDIIIVDIYGIGAFDAFSVTDGPGNTYTENVRSITSSGGGMSTYIFTTTLGASGLLSIVVSTGGVTRDYTFSAAEYSGVVGFGATATTQNDNIGNTNTATSTLSFSNIGSNSWIAENFGSEQVTTGTASFGNGQVSRDQTNCNNTSTNCIVYDVPAPGTTFSLSTTISGIGCGSTAPPCAFFSNVGLELLGNPVNPGTLVTNCYGNCGTPPITIVNTNSTKSINFNQSITLFYEFQSNVNGVINNVTLNYANTCITGRCSVNTLFIAAYSAGICSSVSQPFTAACPGSRLSQTSFSPPSKGRLSMTCPSSCGITNGQWLGIAISASFSGLEINDTNTNLPLFQSNGITPITITSSSSASSLCSGCKMGLWAWITGSVVTGPGPTIPSSGNCGNGIGDYLTCLTTTFCTGTPNPGCTLAGGLFWSMIYSVVGIVGLMWIDHKFLGNDQNAPHVPASAYAFIPIGIQFMFISLGVLPVWWGVLLIMVFTILFTWILLGFARGSGGRPT